MTLKINELRNKNVDLFGIIFYTLLTWLTSTRIIHFTDESMEWFVTCLFYYWCCDEILIWFLPKVEELDIIVSQTNAHFENLLEGKFESQNKQKFRAL